MVLRGCPPPRGYLSVSSVPPEEHSIEAETEYQLQGERAKAMKKLVMEFIERGWIEPSETERAIPACIGRKKGEE